MKKQNPLIILLMSLQGLRKCMWLVALGLACLYGCAMPPAVSNRLDSFVGTRFTNTQEPFKNPENKLGYVWLTPKEGMDFYYKKENEGINTRYYIAVWLDLKYPCSYSLLVSPDDIILSWRNEGTKHVSKCYSNFG